MTGKSVASRWHALAILLFALAALITFRDVLRAGPTSSAMVASGELALISEGDVIFEAWLTARNAHTLATAPHQLFDTPHCAPAERTLTLGVHMITMGLLAVPALLITTNPALAYNFSMSLLLIISALAMYLLVREWTGFAAAGIVAGLLYAFNPIRLGMAISHPSVWDSAWLVFALFFSRRLFAHGRWRDAIGLALACSLQIGASFYPLLAAALMAPAFVVWLLYRYRFENVRVTQLAFVLTTLAVVAALLLGPYLDAREAGEIGDRSRFLYADPAGFMPGGGLFLGWAALGLALIGLMVPRSALSEATKGDPRWAIVVGGLSATVVAMGSFSNELLLGVWPTAPFELPDLYRLLASFVPGLDSIRLVLRLTVALQVAVCILAGVGAAWLIGRAGRRETITSAALIVLALLSIVPEPQPRTTVEVRADPDEIRFFEQLEEAGNRGPILELPLTEGVSRALTAPHRILLTAYHERRTSTCFGSFRGPGRAELVELASQLPARSATKRLRELGFGTVVFYKKNPAYFQKFRQKLRRSGGETLRLLLKSETLVAYELRDVGPADHDGS